MPNPIGELLVSLKAETSAFRTDLTRASNHLRRSTNQMNRQLDQMNRRFTALGNGIRSSLGVLGVGFGATATVQSLRRLTEGALQTAAEIEHMAAAAGLSAERLQVLRRGAGEVGVATQRVDQAMVNLTRRIGDATRGQGELIAISRDYGLALTDASGQVRSTDAVLADLSDIMANAGSQAERSSIAYAAFGRVGAEMTNVVGRGSRALEEMAAKARNAASVIDGDLIRQAEALDTELGNLRLAVETAFDAGLLEEIVGSADDLTDRFDGLTSAARTMGSVVGGAVNQIAGAFDELFQLLEGNREGLRFFDRLLPLIHPGMGGGLSTEPHPEFLRRPTVSSVIDDLNADIGTAQARIRELRHQIQRLYDENAQGSIGGAAILPEDFVRFGPGPLQAELTELERRVQRWRRELAVLQNLPPLPGLRPDAPATPGATGDDDDDSTGRSVRAGREQIDIIDQTIDALRRQVDAVNEQIAALTRSDSEMVTWRATMESVNLIMREGAEFTEGQRQEYDRLTNQLADATQALEEQRAAMEEVRAATQEAEQQNQQLASAFTNFARSAITDVDNVGEAFERLAVQLADLILEMTVFEQIRSGIEEMDLFGSGSGGESGGGGFFSGIGDFFGDLFGGLFAEGGRPPLGRVSIVGEEGPEWFVPDVAGTIVPMDAIGGGGGPTIVNHIDARGAERGTAIAIEQAVRRAVGESVTAVQQMARAGRMRDMGFS